jgi:hypothetical protein
LVSAVVDHRLEVGVRTASAEVLQKAAHTQSVAEEVAVGLAVAVRMKHAGQEVAGHMRQQHVAVLVLHTLEDLAVLLTDHTLELHAGLKQSVQDHLFAHMLAAVIAAEQLVDRMLSVGLQGAHMQSVVPQVDSVAETVDHTLFVPVLEVAHRQILVVAAYNL